jgi:hypothetical protein
MEMVLWSAALSFTTALILFWVKNSSDEQKRIQILLNRTREEMARDYVTKADVHNDIDRVIKRLDRMEEKLDAFMKESRNAVS